MVKACQLQMLFNDHLFERKASETSRPNHKAGEIAELISCRLSELNSKDRLWEFLGTVLRLIFRERSWKALAELSKYIQSAAVFIKNLLKLQKFKFEKKFLLFSFEIVLNFCSLFDFCAKTSRIIPSSLAEWESASFKAILFSLKRKLAANFKTHLLGIQSKAQAANPFDPALPKGSIQARISNYEDIKHWSYLDIFVGKTAFPNLKDKERFLSELTWTYEFLLLKEEYISAKIVESLYVMHLELKNIAEQSQEKTAEFLAGVTSDQPPGSPTSLFIAGPGSIFREQRSDSIFALRRANEPKQSDVRCEVCRIFPCGLHLVCLACGHSVHYSHFLNKMFTESDKCLGCGDCECFKFLRE